MTFKPKELKELYKKAFKDTNDVGLAWLTVKNAGWYLKDGEWKKNGKSKEAFAEILKANRAPMVTQSVLLSRKRFKTREAAVSWLKSHNYKSNKIDETDQYWRARQREPGDFDSKSFRTQAIDNGVKLVIGHLKKK